VKEVRLLERGGNAKIIIMKGVKHYTEDGEYKGKTHKMNGKVHTGAEHSEASKVVSHKSGGPFKLREVNSPMKCWKTHKKVGVKKSPSGRTKNGKIVMVSDCKKK